MTASEPTAKGLHWARHRKPNRRRNVIRTTLGSLAAIAAIGGTVAAAGAQPEAQPFYGATLAQAAAAAHPGCATPDGGRMAYGDAGYFAGHTWFCAEDGQLVASPGWDHVHHGCHVTKACTYVPADVRRDLGIGADEVAIMDWPAVYVLTGQGVREFRA